MKWLMVFDLQTSQQQIKYYTLRVLCVSNDPRESGGSGR